MAKIVKRRRGSSADHATFTGSEGELTVDLTEKTVRVHDGSTQAGFPLARKDMSNVSNAVGIAQLTVADGSADQILKTDGSGNLSFTDAPDVSGSAIGGDLTGTIGNAQIGANKVGVPELNLSDGTNGQVLQTNGSGTLSFVGLGGDITGTINATEIAANKVGISELNVTDGSSGQVLATNGSGDLFFTTNAGGGGGGSSNFVENVFVADGTTTYGPLTVAAPSEESILVFIDGVNQPTTAYSLPTTTTIAFSTAVTTGQKIRVVHLGIATEIIDNSVNGAKIAMGADVAGDTLYYDGTDYRKLSIGTAGQVLATNAGATAPEWTNTNVLPNATGAGEILISDGTSWVGTANPLPAAGSSGNILTSNGSSWASVSAGATGKVLQVVSTTKPDTYTLAGGQNYTNVTGLSVSITPSSATSKVYVFGTINVSGAVSSERVYCRIVRDSTPIAIGDQWGNRIRAGVQYHNDLYSQADTYPLQILDTPSTTSAITYQWQIQTLATSGNGVVNRSGLSADSIYYGTFVSTITAFEIGA